MDRFSRWIEAIPLTDIKATTVAKYFYNEWVCRYGVPDYLISDQGSQFESTIFNYLLNSLDIQRRRTTAYHPASNGMIERVHATLKQTLRCLSDKFPDWLSALPTALLALRTSVNSLGISPSLMLYGEQISIPGVFINPKLTFNEETDDAFVGDLTNHWFQIRDFVLATDVTLSGSKTKEFTPSFPYEHVWIVEPLRKHSLYPKARGPYRVLEVQYPVIHVKIDGIKQAVNIDRCYPAYVLKRDLINAPLPEPIWTEFNPRASEEVNTESFALDRIPRSIGKPILPVNDKFPVVKIDKLDMSKVNKMGQIRL